MKTSRKFLIAILAIAMMIIIIKPNYANAALQSNGGTPATKSMNDWILQIRKMQELGGTLGRTDDISASNLTSNATDLDIHMEKNTEYGAMVILSASAYGNPNKIKNGETTTGNSTGIVMNLNKEWVAALNSTTSANISKAAKRYKNIYTSTYEPKIGDAIKETEGWHGYVQNIWINHSFDSGLIRSREVSIFSYWGQGYNNWETDIGPGYGPTKCYASRAAIVVGTGI